MVTYTDTPNITTATLHIKNLQHVQIQIAPIVTPLDYQQNPTNYQSTHIANTDNLNGNVYSHT